MNDIQFYFMTKLAVRSISIKQEDAWLRKEKQLTEFLRQKQLFGNMQRELLTKQVMSGQQVPFDAPNRWNLLIVGENLWMTPLNHIGQPYQRHQKNAMDWLNANAGKVANQDANVNLQH